MDSFSETTFGSQDSTSSSDTLVQSSVQINPLSGEHRDEPLQAQESISGLPNQAPTSVLGDALKRKVDEILEGNLRRSLSFGMSSPGYSSLHPGHSKSSFYESSPLSTSPTSFFGFSDGDVLDKMLRPCRNRCGATFAYRSSEEDHINFGKCPKAPSQWSLEIQSDIDVDESFEIPTPPSPVQTTSRKRARVDDSSPLISPSNSTHRPLRQRKTSNPHSLPSIPIPIRSRHRKSVLRACRWPEKVSFGSEHDTQVCCSGFVWLLRFSLTSFSGNSVRQVMTIQVPTRQILTEFLHRCDAHIHFRCVGMRENDERLKPDTTFLCPPCQHA